MTYLDTLNPATVAAAIETLSRQDDPANEERLAYAGGDLRFALFMALVDKRLIRMIGLTSGDIGDYAYRDAYDGGATPRQVALDALAADDTYSMLLDGAF